MSQLQVTGEAKIRDIQGPVVANSGVITALDGAASQYVRGDGTLADFPTSSGGGSSVSYYLNSSVSQGTIGGVAYRELSKEPIIGAGTDIAISANGYVASYLTDANDPDVVLIPGGNFNCEFYFSVNNNTGNPFFYAELYKYDGTTFTLLGSSVGVPEYITQGTTIAPYYFAIPVATATLALTDRLAIRIYVNVGGRTVTLHTENGHLCQVVTTLSKGMVSLNNLTDQSQFLAVGTSGTDFNIVSTGDTHTFNIPSASASNRGLITTGSQTIAGSKTFSNTTLVNTIYIDGVSYLKHLTSTSYITGYTTYSAKANGVIEYFFPSSFKSVLDFNDAADYTYTFPAASGTIALTSDLSSYVTLGTTQTITGAKTFTSPTLFDSATINNAAIPSGGLATVSGNIFVSNGISFNETSSPAIFANALGFSVQRSGTTSTINIRRDNVSGSSFTQTLAFSNNAANRTYTFPDANGTVALTSNLSAYLPLTGGTLTGALIGTTATFTNSGTGIGVGITNSGNGDGIKITHSLGRAFNIQSSGSGFGIIINNETASTSIPFTIQKQGGSVVSITDAGELTLANSARALSFVKSGGTSSQYLMADGSTSTLTNPVTGTGTTNYLPKFTGASTIGNSAITDDGTTVTLISRALSGTSATFSGKVGIGATPYTSTTAIIRAVSATSTNYALIIEDNASNQLFEIKNTGAATFSSSITGGLITADNADIYSQNGTGSNLSIGFKQSSAVKFRLRYDIATDIVAMVGSSGNFIQYWNQAGNVGLGVTPSAWTDYKVLQLGGGSISSYTDNNFFEVNQNSFWNGVFRYVNNGFASRYQQTSGRHEWYQAPSGTAGNAITFTQAMTLTAAGRLLLGTTTDSGDVLQVADGSVKIVTTPYSPTGVGFFGTSSNHPLSIITNGSTRLTIASTGAATFSSSISTGTLILSGGTIQSSGDYYIGTNNANFIQFYTSNQNRMIITSGGNVGIGTTTATAKLQISNTSAGAATVAAFLLNESRNINTEVRLAFAANTNNEIASNRYSYISTLNTTGDSNGQSMIFATNENGAAATERMRITSAGNTQPGADNAYSLGVSGIRWSAVWAANGTIQTSDEREKKDIIDADLGLDFISKLRPVSFKWKVGQNIVTSEVVKDEEGNPILDEEGNEKTESVIVPREGKRTHYGLIAQEVEELLDGKDFGGFIHDEETDTKGLRYDQFIPLLIKSIQEQQAQIEELSNKIVALESK
jgi:hypothetical protein